MPDLPTCRAFSSQPVVDDRAAAGEFGAQQRRDLGGLRNLRRLADAATNAEDALGLRQIHTASRRLLLFHNACPQRAERVGRRQRHEFRRAGGATRLLGEGARHHAGDRR